MGGNTSAIDGKIDTGSVHIDQRLHVMVDKMELRQKHLNPEHHLQLADEVFKKEIPNFVNNVRLLAKQGFLKGIVTTAHAYPKQGEKAVFNCFKQILAENYSIVLESKQLANSPAVISGLVPSLVGNNWVCSLAWTPENPMIYQQSLLEIYKQDKEELSQLVYLASQSESAVQVGIRMSDKTLYALSWYPAWSTLLASQFANGYAEVTPAELGFSEEALTVFHGYAMTGEVHMPGPILSTYLIGEIIEMGIRADEPNFIGLALGEWAKMRLVDGPIEEVAQEVLEQEITALFAKAQVHPDCEPLLRLAVQLAYRQGIEQAQKLLPQLINKDSLPILEDLSLEGEFRELKRWLAVYNRLNAGAITIEEVPNADNNAFSVEESSPTSGGSETVEGNGTMR